MKTKNSKIDIVIPWVDGSDPNWLEEKKKYDIDNIKAYEHSNAPRRFREWGVMRYWFRGVEKNMPFINKIFFITWGHVPEWLDIDNEKIVIVKHKDYIPEKYLPTYNSNVIELNVHRIKELSENFILFNDDVFPISMTREDMFFKNDRPCDMLISSIIYNHDVSDIFNHIPFNNMGIINKYFGRKWLGWKCFFKWINPKCGRTNILSNFDMIMFKRIYGFVDLHFTISHKKSVFEKIWELEYENLDKACMNRFRSPMDFSNWLMRYWNFVTGNFEPIRLHHICAYCALTDDDSLETICTKINEHRRPILVINDELGLVAEEKVLFYRNRIIDEFEKLFPEKSSFEKF